MQIMNKIKKLPRWTWFTVGGVAIGYAAIHTWRNRAADETVSNDSADASAPGTGTALMPPGGTGYTGVVVPPVITQAPSGDTQGLTDLLSGFDTLISGFQGLYAPVQDAMLSQYQSSTDTIRDIATGQWSLAALAGSAPTPVAANPSPVQAAPAPAPAPAKNPCPAQYPFQSARGCYQVACKNHKRVHAYPGNIPDQYVGGTC